MPESTRGVLAMLACCTLWGLSPIYYALLKDVPPAEVLAYRALWSLGFFGALLLVQGRLPMLGRALAGRSAGWIALAALLISLNWGGFIWAIQAGQGMEAALGYYILPLVAVLLGRAVFGDALTRAHWAAVGLAGLGVAVLTLGLGVPPWLALMLATTFGLYGVIKKRLPLGPVVSVTAEVALLAPLALLWLGLAGTQGDAGLGRHALLAFSGPLTALPLILFSYAAQRVRLSTLGILQYLNPTLQFLVAVVIFTEPFTPAHQFAFPLIWAALAVYSVASIRQERAVRRAASRPATSATGVT